MFKLATLVMNWWHGLVKCHAKSYCCYCTPGENQIMTIDIFSNDFFLKVLSVSLMWERIKPYSIPGFIMAYLLDRHLNLSCWEFWNVPFLLPSHQPPTHVRRMMDVVPVRICVSSITTALRPAPVHTWWSFLPTSNPALVSQNTFLIFHAFSLCNQSITIGYYREHVKLLLIEVSFYVHMVIIITLYTESDRAFCQSLTKSWIIPLLMISPALKRFLLYVRRSEIRGVDIDNPYMNVMTALTVPDIDDVTVVDYDAQEERIYWADIKTQSIKRAFINGSQLETIISAGWCIPDIHTEYKI